MTETPVAIITAAGRGMGAAIARELHARGYRLALMSPSGSAEALARELGGLGVTGTTARAEDLERLVAETLAAHGRIDAVVNHTGGPPKGDLDALSEAQWDLGHDLVMKSLLRMSALATPVMQKQGKGAFVNITSYAAFEPDLKFPISSVYRAAVSAYTKLYADRHAAENIRMNTLQPGFVDSIAQSEAVIARIPAGRLGTVAEVAKVAAFLLSDEASYVTGQSLRVDGSLGRHM